MILTLLLKDRNADTDTQLLRVHIPPGFGKSCVSPDLGRFTFQKSNPLASLKTNKKPSRSTTLLPMEVVRQQLRGGEEILIFYYAEQFGSTFPE